MLLLGNLKKIIKEKHKNDEHRYIHSLGVAKMAKYLAKEYGDSIVIYKVDTDKEKELSMAMGIQSLPTIVFIPQTGQPQVIVGAADKATFKRAINEVLLNKK